MIVCVKVTVYQQSLQSSLEAIDFASTPGQLALQLLRKGLVKVAETCLCLEDAHGQNPSDLVVHDKPHSYHFLELSLDGKGV